MPHSGSCLSTRRRWPRFVEVLRFPRSCASADIVGARQGESELQALQKLPPGPKTDELRRFYDLSQRIVELNTAVLEGVLAHPSSGRTMSAGRVVILSDGVSGVPFRTPSVRLRELIESKLPVALPRQSGRGAESCPARCPAERSDRHDQAVLRARVCAARNAGRNSR